MKKYTWLLLIGTAVGATLAIAQTASAPILSFTATSANVSGAPDSIRIDVLRWSTDEERDKLLGAWNMTAPAGRGGGAATGRAGGGAGRAGRGAAPAAAAADPPPDAQDGAAADAGDAAAAAPPPAAAGRGGGRGGRGGRGGNAADAPPATPEGSLAAALQQATTVGYLWSSEVAGYAIRYAGKVPGPNGIDRIILITDRRLGAMNDLWKPSGPGTPSAYDFSVIELRVNSKGEGEGRISLTGKVALDKAAKMVAPENYDTLPVVLKNVKRRTS